MTDFSDDPAGDKIEQPTGRVNACERRRASLRQRKDHSIAQGPGPPQRPHMGASDEPDDILDPSAPTANTLSARAVLVEPHLGHFCGSVLLIDRTSWSNRVWQLWQVYSYIGMVA